MGARPTPESEHPITKNLTQLCDEFINLNRLAPKVEDTGETPAEETPKGGRRRKLKGGALVDLPEPEASVPNYDIFQTLGKGMYYYHLDLLKLERSLRVNHATRYNIFNKAYTTVVPYFKGEQLANYEEIVPTLEALEQSRCLYIEGWGKDVEETDAKGISKKRVDQSPYCDIEIKEGTESKSHRFGTATSKYLPNELEPKIDALEKAIEAAETAGFLADQLTEFKDEVSSLKRILDANNEEIKQNMEKATNSWGERKIDKHFQQHGFTQTQARRLLVEILEEEIKSFGLLTVVGDAHTGARDNLAGITLSIHLAETSPLSEEGVVVDLHQVDGVLGAQGLNELLVCRLVAVVSKNAQVHGTLVEHLRALTDATSQAVSAERLLEHLLERGHSVQRLGVDDLNWSWGLLFDFHVLVSHCCWKLSVHQRDLYCPMYSALILL